MIAWGPLRKKRAFLFDRRVAESLNRKGRKGFAKSAKKDLNRGRSVRLWGFPVGRMLS